MLMKVQAKLRRIKVSKNRPQIAPDWNGLRPSKSVIFRSIFLVHLELKSKVLYYTILIRSKSMILGQKNSPASFRNPSKQVRSS
jgi:hypothetical protein